MEKVATLSKKILLSTKNIHDKKPYIEFFTAILSVPVLITVIMLNINNLKSTNKSTTASPSPVQKEEKIYIPVITTTQNTNKKSTPQDSVTPTEEISQTPTNQACKPEIGPVSISSPDEGDALTDNPVSIIINYKTGEYCAVVWSYRLNGSSWSAYDDKSIALYNLPPGKIKIEVKIKSIVSGDEQILTRNFTYNGTTTAAAPTPTPTLTPSPTVPAVSPTISPETTKSSSSIN